MIAVTDRRPPSRQKTARRMGHPGLKSSFEKVGHPSQNPRSRTPRDPGHPAQMGRAHPYETSRNLVIRGTHSSENRGSVGHRRLNPFVAMIPLWELWLPSFRKMGLTSMPGQGSAYRLILGVSARTLCV